VHKFLIASLFVALSSLSLHGQQQAVQSDTFVDSVGINIHLHYTETPYYNDFPLIQKSLVNLGVRHTRDGLVSNALQAYYDRHNALGALGIKGIYITNTNETASVFQGYPALVSKDFEGFENPNELDGTANWVSLLTGFVPTLYSAAAATTPRFPVIGPSLTQTNSYSLLGNLSSHFDIGNIHNYFAGRNPGTPGWDGHGYGSIPFDLANERIVSGSKPIWSTETGYDNGANYVNYVSESVSAMYLPRLLLEQFNAGIQRTYIYELLTEGGNDFGLMRADGSYKPAYYAVSNLLNLLADKGAAFAPGKLNYTLSGGNSNLHHLLLQKRDGSFYLALWVEAQNYDPDAHTNIAVPAQNVTLKLAEPLSIATRYQWQADGSITTSTLPAVGSIPLTVTGQLQIIRLNTQSACTYTFGASPLPSLNNGLYALASNGGSADIPVTTQPGCNAQPTTSGGFITASFANGTLHTTATANKGGFRIGTFTLGDNTASVLQAANGYTFVQVNSNIPNASVNVDGLPYLTGSWLTWATGSHHTLNGEAQQQVGPQVYLFDGWTSGTTNGIVTAPVQTTVYTSHLTAANYLDAAATPGGTVSVSPQGPLRFNLPYYRATDIVTAHATPAPGCTFNNWAGANNTTNSTLPIHINAPSSLVAVFTCAK